VLSRKKPQKVTGKIVFQGIPRVEDGNEAILEVESRACDAIGIRPAAAGAGYHPWSRPLERTIEPRQTTLRAVDTSHALAGLVAGFASTGLRSAALTRGRTLAEMHESLVASVRRRLAFIVNHTCEANDRHTASSQGSHDDYFSVADSGIFQLFAKNVQEAVDLTLIAHRIAELSLNPGVCAKDGDLTGRSAQNLLMPESDLIDEYLGAPDDILPCATPAQTILFGDERQRIPAFLDMDKPLGIGATLDRDNAYKALASQDTFFFNHVATIADEAMAAYREMTGRSYARVSGYRIDDAEYVIVGQGAVVGDLERVVDTLRKRQVRAGILNLTMFRPFPGDLVSHLLKGKKAVTVLERTHRAQAEDLHMLKEIRCALDKAVANGAKHREESSYPGYASYGDIMDRPRLFSGIYGGAGSFPSFDELYTVFTNMLPEGDKKNGFYLGVHLDRPDLRFPRLERLQQTIRKNYADLSSRSLNAGKETISSDILPRSFTFQTHTKTEWEGSFSGRILAKALFEALGWQVKSVPQFSHHRGHRSCIYTVTHTQEETPTSGGAGPVDGMMISTQALVKGTLSLSGIKDEGVVVIHTEKDPEQWWSAVPAKVRRDIRNRNLRVYFLNAHRIARETSSGSTNAHRLSIHVLVGAFLKVYPHVPLSHLDLVLDHYRIHLNKVFGGNQALIDDHACALQQGIEAVSPVTWDSYPSVEDTPVPEPEAPWTVRETVKSDNSIYDLSRFWNTVGYMHETGQEALTLADPFVATGMIPSRSSVFRNLLPFRTHTPRLLPEKCTACGSCWTYCPDSSLPVTVQDISTLIDKAIEACEAAGHCMIQFQRIAQNLATLARKKIASKTASFKTLGGLLIEAFSTLVEMMKPKEDQLISMKEEFNHVLSVVSTFPVVKTETFFNIPEKSNKGSGLLFSMAINLNTCKECALCVDVCPEDAMEMVELDDMLVKENHDSWTYLMNLPEVAENVVQNHVSEDRPESLSFHFLNKRVYHALVGGDMAMPGNGIKTAVHLIVGLVEANRLPLVYTLQEQIDNLIKGLKEKTQATVSKAITIDDFEVFGEKLAGTEGQTIDLEALSSMLGAEMPRGLDASALKRFTDNIAQLSQLKKRYQTGDHGDGRARIALSMGTDPLFHWIRTYPYNAVSFPWIRHISKEETAVSIGVFEGVMKQMAATFRTVRLARLLLDNKYDPEKHDEALKNLSWRDFTEKERAQCPTFLVLASKIDEQLSLLLRSQLPIKVVVVNTQRSCREEHRFVPREPGIMALALRNIFVLQSTTGNPGHLLRGVKEGLSFDGPAFFHIYATDPYEQGLTPVKAVEQSKRVYQSRAFPLYMYNPENGPGFLDALTLDGNPDLDLDWATWNPEQDTVAAGGPLSLTFADWAAQEKHLQDHFREITNEENNLMAVTDYLDLPDRDRAGKTPYVTVIYDSKKEVMKAVSPEMVAETERRRSTWRALLELAGIRSNLAAFYAGKAEAEMEVKLAQKKEEAESAYTSRLAELERPHVERYHEQLMQQLLLLSGYDPAGEKSDMSLRDYDVQRKNNDRDS